MSYHDQVADFANVHQEEAERIYRAAMLQVMAGVVQDTPVLDGYLRGAWLIGLGSRANGGEIQDRTGSIVMSRIAQAVASATLDTEVWFSNALPYASRIEYEGWSRHKAPQGMLRRNLARWEEYVRNL